MPLEQIEQIDRHRKAICIAKTGYDRELGCIKQYLFKIQLELIKRNIFFFEVKKKSFFKKKKRIVFTLWFVKCSNIRKIKKLRSLLHLTKYLSKDLVY